MIFLPLFKLQLTTNYMPSTYYNEPGILDNPFLNEYLFWFLAFGFVLFLFFVKKFFSGMENKKKDEFIKSMVISSPIWIVALSVFLIFRVFSILHGELNPLIDIFTVLIIYIYLFVYIF